MTPHSRRQRWRNKRERERENPSGDLNVGHQLHTWIYLFGKRNSSTTYLFWGSILVFFRDCIYDYINLVHMMFICLICIYIYIPLFIYLYIFLHLYITNMYIYIYRVCRYCFVYAVLFAQESVFWWHVYEAKMDGMAAIYYWGLKQSAEASAASGAPAAGWVDRGTS